MRKFLFMLPLALIVGACGSDDNSSDLKFGQGPSYLALGDSISFGYSPLVELNQANVDAGLFVGFPEVVAGKLGYNLLNPACSGETSASLIDRTAKDNGCHSGDSPNDQFLKVSYEVSQLDLGVSFLKQNPDTKLVTINIGGNDILLAEDECNLEAVPVLCKATRVPGIVVNFGKNLVTTVKAIRAAGYTGNIVFVSNYARDYKDAIQKIALGTLNAEVKLLSRFHGFKVASGFEAFDKASKDTNGNVCAAGLTIALPEGGCNQHPSQKGRELLAQIVLDALKP